MRKQLPVWLAATKSLTTPEIAPAFAAVKRSFAGSRRSIDGKGRIWRSGLGEDDGDLVFNDKVWVFPGVQQGLCSSVDDLFHRLNALTWYVISWVNVIYRH